MLRPDDLSASSDMQTAMGAPDFRATTIPAAWTVSCGCCIFADAYGHMQRENKGRDTVKWLYVAGTGVGGSWMALFYGHRIEI
ncbi:hypothetical protein HPB50_016865 [Hyalomma asiaticum]|uniref:Uncharacterized protein n=1 Tax=Hyalomma asiaticum TaxID=266040 RepID=A0ACB7S0X3_HYAAI|nr:hypothetical protein HPB50_016865 [Hyalomma asiaticum]